MFTGCKLIITILVN